MITINDPDVKGTTTNAEGITGSITVSTGETGVIHMTKCIDCMHNKVCKHKEEYSNIVAETDRLINFKFNKDVFDIKVECKHYTSSTYTIKYNDNDGISTPKPLNPYKIGDWPYNNQPYCNPCINRLDTVGPSKDLTISTSDIKEQFSTNTIEDGNTNIKNNNIESPDWVKSCMTCVDLSNTIEKLNKESKKVLYHGS